MTRFSNGLPSSYDEGGRLQRLNGLSVMRLHELMLIGERHHRHDIVPTGVWYWVEANHHYNALLWDEEDKARRTDVGDEEIADAKRAINRYNQKRNDAVEALDESILAELRGTPTAADARLNSETAGSMIDRLSILALKTFHMRQQTERRDVNALHIETCRLKCQRLATQRSDLAFCLDRLLSEAIQGTAYFKVYRQLKMYNDPALTPSLYRQSVTAEA